MSDINVDIQRLIDFLSKKIKVFVISNIGRDYET